MIIYRLITGIANGFAFLAALHVVYYWFPKKNASVSGLMIAFGMSGGGFASILFSHLFVHIGLKSGLGINVGIGTAILLIAFLFLHDHKDTNKQITSFPSFAKNIRFVAYIPQNWFCGIYTGMLNLSIYILAALWGNLYLIERYSLKNTVAASIVAMIFLGIIIGSPLWGWFSDRIHSRKKPMLFGGILSLIMILRILFADDPSTISLIILFFSLGIATSSQVISYSTIAESNNKKLISTATSFAALIINFIGAVGQFLFGWLLSVFWNGQMKNNLPIYSGNNLKLALLSLIVAFWLACIMVFFIQEPK
jgi:MFS family permease